MSNEVLKNHVLEVLNNQLKLNSLLFVNETFDRLIKIGYTEKQVKEKMAAILLEEIYYVLKNQEVFNEERYKDGLSRLV